MSTNEIIVVEDEPKISQLLSDYLQRDGFTVTILDEGSGAVEVIRSNQPALVILDLMLPGKDGLTICKEIRQFSELPIVILTARIDEIDRLVGLELGADDYICKPFSPREVVARVRAILRRVQSPPAQVVENQLTFRDLTLHLDRFECLMEDRRIDLTPVEFRILQTLMSQPGRVYAREALMNSAYSDGRVVSDRTIDTHVKNLRKKLSQGSQAGELIRSIYGVGYKIE